MAILYTFVPNVIQALQIDLGIEVIPLAGLYTAISRKFVGKSARDNPER